MTTTELELLYDREYAANYNNNFLLGEHFRECTEYEISLVQGLLQSASNWLDVACGTGYFLSRFPGVDRCGLDLSPAMLDQARCNNPGVCFIQDDYRSEVPNWRDRWDLVSCTWYAYCYAESLSGVEKVLSNLAAWTAPTGACFLPVCDPDVLCKVKIPYRPPSDSSDGRLEVTAVIWNWIDEPSGRSHIGLIAPHIDHLVSLFESWFYDVRVFTYPTFQRDCLQTRRAIVARSKRS